MPGRQKLKAALNLRLGHAQNLPLSPYRALYRLKRHNDCESFLSIFYFGRASQTPPPPVPCLRHGRL